jgi:predicted Zn-dependent peptidase
MKIREDRFPTFRTFMKGLKTKRREWFKIVTSNGGVNNANTSDDRTYYYVILPI